MKQSKARRWWRALRNREEEWFKAMFAKSFAEWHEVDEEQKKKLGYPTYFWEFLLPRKPRAKHEDYAGLEKRMKAVERKVCDHVFGDPRKGCVEAIVCSKCGTIHPDWEKNTRYDSDGETCEGWTPPEFFVNGTGYIKKKATPCDS